MFLFIIFHVTYVIDIHSVVFVLSPFLNVKQAKQPAACGNESTENKKQKSFTKTITIQFQHLYRTCWTVPNDNDNLKESSVFTFALGSIPQIKTSDVIN